MKTTIPFVHFCDHASMSTDGKLNLSGIFESLFAMEVPTRHPQMVVLTRLHLGKGDHSFLLTLQQEDRVLAKTNFDLNVTQKTQEQNHLWSVFNLELHSYTPVELKVYENGIEIDSIALPIYRLPKPLNLPPR